MSAPLLYPRLAGVIAEPVSGQRVVFATSLAPADFLDRIGRDLSAQRLAHQLAAKAVADDRYVLRDGIANQDADRFNPR